MHLHIVFVLLYVLCVSLCRCSFVCVRYSIFYVCVTCCDLDVTRRERAREGESEEQRPLACNIKRKEIKSGTSGCGSFVVPYFQPATFTTDHLQYIYPCAAQNCVVLLQAAHTFCVSVLCVHVVFDDKHALNLMWVRACIYVYPRSR